MFRFGGGECDVTVVTVGEQESSLGWTYTFGEWEEARIWTKCVLEMQKRRARALQDGVSAL